MIFYLKDGILRELEDNPYILERDLQQFFETHLATITGYQVLHSEFSINGYRMDSVSFDVERMAFVIIEYKRGQNESLVDQGYAYLNTVLDRRADFVLLYNEKAGESKSIKDFDWSQTRIAFVSPKFTKYQKDATNFNKMAFELYEIKRYADNIVSVEQINQEQTSNVKSYFSDKTNKPKAISNDIITKVEKQLKVYNLEVLHSTP